MLKKPDAILFDWDGTLIESLHSFQSFYNHVLAAYNMPLITIDEARRRVRKSAREFFPELFGDKSDEALEIYVSYVRENHLKYLKEIDGAHEFINTLSTMNIPLGVVSNKRNEFLNREIENIPWGNKMNVVVGAGVAPKDKPAADPLLLAIQKLGLDSDKNHIWYVGDTETDMQTAIAANCAPVFIEHGFATREECAAHGIYPNCVSGFTDLINLLRNMD